jgi:hypothetical protein
MPKRRASDSWSEMAAEVRAIARSTRDPDAKTRLLEIAAGYDKLAARAADIERRRGGQRTEDPPLSNSVRSRWVASSCWGFAAALVLIDW